MRKVSCCVLAAAMAGGAFASSALAVNDAYLIDLRFSTATNRLIRFPVNAPALNVLSTTGTYRGFAIDFDHTATTLYGITNPGNVLGTINQTTGNFTPGPTITGPSPAETNWSGLSVGPDGTFWGSASGGAGQNRLYTINPGTGVATLVGSMGLATAINIDIAVDNMGNMYGHDIANDQLLSINTTTGAATVIGSTGQPNANFAQGMDFDWETNTLYAALYTGGGTGAYGTFNLGTGLFTSIQSTTAWNIEAEMAVKSPIPEPASLGLLSVAGMALLRRRRTQ